MQHILTVSLIIGFSTSALSYDTRLMARVIEKHACIESLGAVVAEPEICWSWTKQETAEPFVDAASSSLFIGGSDGLLHVLEPKKGVTQRRLKLQGNLVSAPVPLGSDLVFGTDRGFVYRVAKDSLATAWKIELDSGVLQTPYLAKDKVIFVTQLGTIYALKAENGDVIWSKKRELPNRIILKHLSTPIAFTSSVNGTAREILAIGNPNGKLEFLDIENANPVDEMLLGSKELFGDVATTPVLEDKILYAASFNNSLVAIDSENRVRKWELKEKGITQLACGNGIIVAAGAKFVLGVNAKTGKELWRFSFHKGAAAAIHIKNREVIVGSDIDGLYVLDLMTGQPVQVLGSGLGFSSPVHEFENDLLAMSSAGALFFFNRTDQVVSGRKLALERYESGR